MEKSLAKAAAGTDPAAVCVPQGQAAPSAPSAQVSSTLPIRPDAPWLAPLAGWSDLAFRLLCREQGAAVCCTEMISAKGLAYHSKGTAELTATVPEDQPLVAQLFGAEPDMLAPATEILMGWGFRYFDINMGCSVPKVVKTGAGAALLRNPELAVQAARAVIDVAGPGRVGVKLRLGWGQDRPVWHELGPELARAGAAWLTLHPRFGTQAFSGVAAWERIAELKSLVAVPVIASGDLLTAEDAVRCLAQTGADAVMPARGALADPMIFSKIRALLAASGRAEAQAAATQSPESTPPGALHALIRRHCELSLRHHGERTTLLKMRTFVPRYVRHIPGARALRIRLIHSASLEEIDTLLTEFFAAGENAAENAQPEGSIICG